ncbi:MAG: hypothetical protein ACRD4Y_18200 [Candidatus Acidiferrales bacterium]
MPALPTQSFNVHPDLSTCGTIPGLMRIALDTGGTFTDCIYLRGGRIEILKVL